MEQLVARQAHNLEVARSNPASATLEAQVVDLGFFRYMEAESFTCCRSTFIMRDSVVPKTRQLTQQQRLVNQHGASWVFLPHSYMR